MIGSPRPATNGAPNAAAVELREASVFYGEVVGLSRVDLTLEGGIYGIVGPNGSGKTTLMRVLTGLCRPDEGTARVFGGNPFDQAGIRTRIAFVSATEPFHRDLSGRKNLEWAFECKGHTPAEARILAEHSFEASGLAADAHRKYGTWSRGMRQRLKIGCALAGDETLVLLDEPFLGVDPPSRRELRNLIERLGASGRTVLVSSHVLHEIESLTDRVAVLGRGRLLGFGRIEDILLELRDRHPHRVRLEADDPRRFATVLVTRPHVRELRLLGTTALEFVTDAPSAAYREIGSVVAESGALVRRIETLDAGLEAVFRHVTEAGARHL